MSEVLEAFRNYVTSSGVDFDALTVEQKREWRRDFELARQQPAAGGAAGGAAGDIEVMLAKKRKSMEEATRAKDTCPIFFEESLLVAHELDTVKCKALSTMEELIKCKDELHALQAERAVYLKAALKMFQRGIVELELQVFLGMHTTRSKNNKQLQCESAWYNCDFSILMRHWRTCPLHSSPPVIIERKQVDVRLFRAERTNVENAVDSLYASLSTPQHFKTDYPIKLTPFTEDADTLALVSFLEFYNVEYCLLCYEQGKIDS